MTHSLPFIGSSALLVVALSAQPILAQPLQANTWTVLAGQVVRYNTSNGPLILDSLQFDPGGTLRVHGSQPFRVLANRVQIDGTLDLSGFDARPVFTLNMTSTPSSAAEGGPSGGIGGGGSLSTRRATLQGEDGKSWAGVSLGGGRGGESGWSLGDVNAGGNRHAAGGGGGQFGPSELISGGDPESLANVGRIAHDGVDGSVQALGGKGGEGSMNQYRAVGAGGNGGPGLIQLHVPGGSSAHVSLPGGVSLDELSAPHAHLLGLQAGL